MCRIGDIAIDDIVVLDGECPYVPTPPPECAFHCDNENPGTSVCIPSAAVCDFNIDCVENSIDELDCGYVCI